MAYFPAAVAGKLGVSGHWILTGEGNTMQQEDEQATLREVPTRVLLQEIANRIERKAVAGVDVGPRYDGTSFVHPSEDRAARHRRDR